MAILLKVAAAPRRFCLLANRFRLGAEGYSEKPVLSVRMSRSSQTYAHLEA